MNKILLPRNRCLYYLRTSNMRKFSVASAYIMLAEDGWKAKNFKWRAVWKWKGPQRIRIFLWLALNNRLLTNDQRRRCHLTQVSSCNLCHTTTESLLHVLSDCGFSHSVWVALFSSLSIPTPVASDFFSDNREVWLLRNISSQGEFNVQHWGVLFGIMCCSIWNSRNQTVFSPIHKILLV